MLYATCQRLNDGSQSTPQLSLLSVSVHGQHVHVGSHVLECVCVIIDLNVPLCVFLRSRVNYIGHDVKGRSLVGENTAGSYHGDSTANSRLFHNSSATVISVIYIDYVPSSNYCSSERHFRCKGAIAQLNCFMLIVGLQIHS